MSKTSPQRTSRISESTKGSLHRASQSLVKGDTDEVTIEFENNVCVQFEFYIPAAVFRHSAVRRFLNRLDKLAAGATISKGAIGAWEGDEEDVNIYRVILAGDFDREAVRSMLHSEIADVMASLAESKETVQRTFIFTEAELRLDCSTLRRKSK